MDGREIFSGGGGGRGGGGGGGEWMDRRIECYRNGIEWMNKVY